MHLVRRLITLMTIFELVEHFVNLTILKRREVFLDVVKGPFLLYSREAYVRGHRE